MNLTNLTELELYFANHFDTVLFPVLAEIYQSKSDYRRAKRVCEIGLEHHPNSIDGQFILSQAELGLGNLDNAEKWMKRVLVQIPDHTSAATSLPMVQEQLGRSTRTLTISWNRAQRVNPDNKFAKDYFSAKKSNLKKKKGSKLETPAEKNSKKQLPTDISSRLATFTLVNVLKAQGLYHKALDVLDILAETGADQKRIESEREIIKAEL